MATVTPLGLGHPEPEGEPGGPRVGVHSLPAIMSPAQLAKELDVSVRTLERWREARVGPDYRNPAGTRLYRYYGSDVANWLENKKPAVAAAGQNN